VKGYRELSDAHLIRAAKSGDRQAFEALAIRYEETIYKFAFKMCHDREKAAETLQDTFISLFRKLSSYNGRSKFSTWLYAVVTNNCLMKQRRRKIQGLEDPLEVYDYPPEHRGGKQRTPMVGWQETPADLLLRKELRTTLDRAIAKLPLDYRVVFILRDVEGTSTEETAKILRISIEATKSRLRRARAFLRDQLHPYVAHHQRVTA
jgi:RNA polymerase sigma-70 factor (ECF subfamily)